MEADPHADCAVRAYVLWLESGDRDAMLETRIDPEEAFKAGWAARKEHDGG